MLGEERLSSRLSTSESEKTNVASVEIDLCADEPMRPSGIDEEATAKHRNLSAVIGASNEDDRPARMCLQVEESIRRHRCSCWCTLDSESALTARGGNVAVGVIE